MEAGERVLGGAEDVVVTGVRDGEKSCCISSSETADILL